MGNSLERMMKEMEAQRAKNSPVSVTPSSQDTTSEISSPAPTPTTALDRMKREMSPVGEQGLLSYLWNVEKNVLANLLALRTPSGFTPNDEFTQYISNIQKMQRAARGDLPTRISTAWEDTGKLLNALRSNPAMITQKMSEAWDQATLGGVAKGFVQGMVQMVITDPGEALFGTTLTEDKIRALTPKEHADRIRGATASVVGFAVGVGAHRVVGKSLGLGMGAEGIKYGRAGLLARNTAVGISEGLAGGIPYELLTGNEEKSLGDVFVNAVMFAPLGAMFELVGGFGSKSRFEKVQVGAAGMDAVRSKLIESGAPPEVLKSMGFQGAPRSAVRHVVSPPSAAQAAATVATARKLQFDPEVDSVQDAVNKVQALATSDSPGIAIFKVAIARENQPHITALDVGADDISAIQNLLASTPSTAKDKPFQFYTWTDKDNPQLARILYHDPLRQTIPAPAIAFFQQHGFLPSERVIINGVESTLIDIFEKNGEQRAWIHNINGESTVPLRDLRRMQNPEYSSAMLLTWSKRVIPILENVEKAIDEVTKSKAADATPPSTPVKPTSERPYAGLSDEDLFRRMNTASMELEKTGEVSSVWELLHEESAYRDAAEKTTLKQVDLSIKFYREQIERTVNTPEGETRKRSLRRQLAVYEKRREELLKAPDTKKQGKSPLEPEKPIPETPRPLEGDEELMTQLEDKFKTEGKLRTSEIWKYRQAVFRDAYAGLDNISLETLRGMLSDHEAELKHLKKDKDDENQIALAQAQAIVDAYKRRIKELERDGEAAPAVSEKTNLNAAEVKADEVDVDKLLKREEVSLDTTNRPHKDKTDEELAKLTRFTNLENIKTPADERNWLDAVIEYTLRKVENMSLTELEDYRHSLLRNIMSGDTDNFWKNQPNGMLERESYRLELALVQQKIENRRVGKTPEDVVSALIEDSKEFTTFDRKFIHLSDAELQIEISKVNGPGDENFKKYKELSAEEDFRSGEALDDKALNDVISNMKEDLAELRKDPNANRQRRILTEQTIHVMEEVRRLRRENSDAASAQQTPKSSKDWPKTPSGIPIFTRANLINVGYKALRRIAKQVKEAEESVERRILGEDYKEWQKAQSAQNSLDQLKADRAADRIEEIESKLPQQDRDALYGINEPYHLNAEELELYANAADSAEELAPDLNKEDLVQSFVEKAISGKRHFEIFLQADIYLQEMKKRFNLDSLHTIGNAVIRRLDASDLYTFDDLVDYIENRAWKEAEGADIPNAGAGLKELDVEGIFGSEAAQAERQKFEAKNLYNRFKEFINSKLNSGTIDKLLNAGGNNLPTGGNRHYVEPEQVPLARRWWDSLSYDERQLAKLEAGLDETKFGEEFYRLNYTDSPDQFHIQFIWRYSEAGTLTDQLWDNVDETIQAIRKDTHGSEDIDLSQQGLPTGNFAPAWPVFGFIESWWTQLSYQNRLRALHNLGLKDKAAIKVAESGYDKGGKTTNFINNAWLEQPKIKIIIAGIEQAKKFSPETGVAPLPYERLYESAIGADSSLDPMERMIIDVTRPMIKKGFIQNVDQFRTVAIDLQRIPAGTAGRELISAQRNVVKRYSEGYIPETTAEGSRVPKKLDPDSEVPTNTGTFKEAFDEFIKQQNLTAFNDLYELTGQLRDQVNADLARTLDPQDRAFLKTFADLLATQQGRNLTNLASSNDFALIINFNHEFPYKIYDEASGKIFEGTSEDDVIEFINKSGQKDAPEYPALITPEVEAKVVAPADEPPPPPQDGLPPAIPQEPPTSLTGTGQSGAGSDALIPPTAGPPIPSPIPSNPFDEPYVFSGSKLFTSFHSWFSTVGSGLTPFRAISTSLDEMLGTEFFRKVFTPLQEVRQKADLAMKPWVEKLHKDVESLANKFKKSDRELVEHYIRFKTPDELKQYGPNGKGFNGVENYIIEQMLADNVDPKRLLQIHDERAKIKKAYGKDRDAHIIARQESDARLRITKKERQFVQMLWGPKGYLKQSLETVSLPAIFRYVDAERNGIRTRDEFTAVRGISPDLTALAEKTIAYRAELAREFGISNIDELYNLLDYADRFRNGDTKKAFAEYSETGIRKLEDYSMYHDMFRHGLLSATDKDPIRFTQRLLKTFVDARHVMTALEAANGAAKTELGRIADQRMKGKVHKIMKQHINDLMGFPGVEGKYTQAATEFLLKRFGINAAPNVRRNIVNAITTMVSGALQGARIHQGIRDFGTGTGFFWVRFGAKRTAKMIEYGFGGLDDPVGTHYDAKLLLKEGAIHERMPLLISDPSDLVNTPTGRMAGKAVRGINWLSEKGMKISGQQFFYEKLAAGMYLETWKFAGEQLQKLSKSEITKKEAYNEIGLDTYELAVGKEFDRLVREGKNEEAAKFLGKQTIYEQMNVYGMANHPSGWNRNFMRLFGQFGVYPTWMLTQIRKSVARGTPRQRITQLARLAGFTAGLMALQEESGIDFSSWQLLNGIMFTGGPAWDMYGELADAIQGRGAYQQSAAGRLKRLVPGYNEDTGWRLSTPILPGSFFAQDLLDAFVNPSSEDLTPGQITAKALGFKTIDPEDYRAWPLGLMDRFEE